MAVGTDDAGGEVDISYLIGDAIGGVELADLVQICGSSAKLFQEFAAGHFFGG